MIPVKNFSVYTYFGDLNSTLNYLKNPCDFPLIAFNGDIPLFYITKKVIEELGELASCSSFSISKPAIYNGRIYGYNDFNDFIYKTFKFSKHINIQAACATGIYSIFAGYRNFYPMEFIAGAAEATTSNIYISAFKNMGCLAEKTKPFDRYRNGFHIGIGAGAFFISGKDPFALIEISLVNDTAGNTFSFTELSADFILKMLDRLVKKKPDFIQPHATGTKKNDEVEINALKKFFGSELKGIPVIPLKHHIGHTLGASGAVELAISLGFLKSGFLPGYELEEPDEFMDGVFVPEKSINGEFKSFLKLSYGFGGHMSACFVEKL